MPTFKSSILVAWIAALVLGLVSNTASAIVPRISGTPVVANPSFGGVANTMMYTVTFTVDGMAADADHTASVGFTKDYTTCMGTPRANWKWAPNQTFDTTDTRTWTLWNFQPGETYYYKVRVGPTATSRSKCGVLTTAAAPTPTVPEDLAALEFQYAKAGASNPFYTKYVIMETDDCGGTIASPMAAHDYLVALDPENETIVWYLELEAMTGIRNATGSGWRYQPGKTATSGRILMEVSHQYLYEWTFDGTETNYHNFGEGGECAGDSDSIGPCIHHDAFRSEVNGRTYVLGSTLSSQAGTGTDWEAECGADAYFVDDGYQVLSPAGAVLSQHSLMADYGWDPTVYGGPNAAELSTTHSPCEADTFGRIFDPSVGWIDWTHANALSASMYGPTEVLDFSLKDWDAILRIDARTGARIWTLASLAADSDWGTLLRDPSIVRGPAAFGDQHDAHAIGDNVLMMFDNTGSPMGSRVLRITLDSSLNTATIDRSWAVMDGSGDPLVCPVEGSGEVVEGSGGANVLANCNDENTIVELSDATGTTGVAPPLVISFPSATDFCSAGGSANSNDLRGWHRAFPLTSLGAF